MAFIFRAHLISLNKRMDRGEFVDFGQEPINRYVPLINEELRCTEVIDEEEAVRQRETFRYLI